MRNPVRALAVALAIAILTLPIAVSAQEARDNLRLNIVLGYSPPNLDGYASTGFAPIDFTIVPAPDSDSRDLGTGWGGGAALASLEYSRTIPAFVGEGPFFSGNNLELSGRVELSPVTVEASGTATLTPIAFLKFQAGAAVGTGWTLGFVGLALRPAGGPGEIEEIPFGGALLRTWLSGTFQFDLAALLPGDWNHVVVQAVAKFEYRALSAADPGEAWIWQADAGLNFNGWRHLGTYVLGYQMPRKLNFAGVMVETEAWLGDVREYSTMGSSGWGSDFVTVTISPLANLAFDERNSLTFLVQLKSTQDWSDGTTQSNYLNDRDYAGRLWKLDRILFSYSRKLK